MSISKQTHSLECVSTAVARHTRRSRSRRPERHASFRCPQSRHSKRERKIAQLSYPLHSVENHWITVIFRCARNVARPQNGARRHCPVRIGHRPPGNGPPGYPACRALTLQWNIGLSTDFEYAWQRFQRDTAPSAVQRIPVRSILQSAKHFFTHANVSTAAGPSRSAIFPV